jgi:hypothetical protein
MKHIFLLSICVLISLLSIAQHTSKITKLLNDRVRIEIPSDFHLMTVEEYQLKYRKPSKVTAAYADKDLRANIQFSYQESVTLSEDDLYDMVPPTIEQMKKGIPSMKVLSQGVKIINGHKYIFLKFTTVDMDQVIFNSDLFGVLDKKLLFFNFNCPERMKSDWDPEADTMWFTIEQKK